LTVNKEAIDNIVKKKLSDLGIGVQLWLKSCQLNIVNCQFLDEQIETLFAVSKFSKYRYQRT
jgi:hypothetical protein